MQCGVGEYLVGCDFVGNPGICANCSKCGDNMTVVAPCGDGGNNAGDTVCVDTKSNHSSSSCAASGVLLKCGEGEYHAGCDPVINETGWCEICPVPSAMHCPENHFLDFECGNGTLSSEPNECLPCNRFACPSPATYIGPGDCGNLDIATTMLAKSINCSQECTEPKEGEWVERACQAFTLKQGVD
ncbi:hypothetical protein T484DRAFT_1755347 [Baffinella frigidus]|nr:hypothetical protein T484DRAFT_1755347 [Cryptophyta sp. CCMP2293]